MSETKNELIMLIGLAGSGKSEYAKVLSSMSDYVIHSSDSLRKELYGDENDQEHNHEVFTELHKRIKADLVKRRSVIYDATNLNRKRRISFLKEIENINCEKVAYMVMCGYGQCLSQNASRDRSIPESAIFRQYCSWQPASIFEGFNRVHFYFSSADTDLEKYRKPGFWVANDYPFTDFDQENSHHRLTLGGHLKSAHDFVKHTWPEDYRLEVASALHDIGKAYTKSFVDRHGNHTQEAHYYDHHKVSAYESVFYMNFNQLFSSLSVNDIAYISNLVERHMAPFMEWRQSEKSKLRDIKIFGEEFISDINKLHQADLFAH